MIKICKDCNITFETETTQKRYCSRKCQRKVNKRKYRKKRHFLTLFSSWRGLVIELLGGLCFICKTDKKIEIDHIIPLYKGGKNTISNVQLLCNSCHIEKSNKEKYTKTPQV